MIQGAKGGGKMTGTKIGGLRAAQTNKKQYGVNFYEKIGRIGGKVSRGGGFTKNPELAKIAGRKGGLRSAMVRKAK